MHGDVAVICFPGFSLVVGIIPVPSDGIGKGGIELTPCLSLFCHRDPTSTHKPVPSCLGSRYCSGGGPVSSRGPPVCDHSPQHQETPKKMAVEGGTILSRLPCGE